MRCWEIFCCNCCCWRIKSDLDINFSPDGEFDSEDDDDDAIGEDKEDNFSSLFGLIWWRCWLNVRGGWGRRWVGFVLEQWDKSKPFVRIRRVNDGRRWLSSDDLFVSEESSSISGAQQDIRCIDEQSVKEWWTLGTSS